jgi:hypothetical protein
LQYFPLLRLGEWVRVSLTFTRTLLFNFFDIFNNCQHTHSIDFWGVQIERGSEATELITTNGYRRTVTEIESSGLLIEQSSSNIVTYSTDFSQTAWEKQGSHPYVANAAVAPDGTTTATQFYRTANDQFMWIGPSNEAGTFTISAWVRSQGGSGRFTMQSYSPTDGGQATTFTAENHWKRFSRTVTVTVATGFYPCIPTDLNENFYVWGVQVERGSFPTSYIPTSGNTVTRDADDVRILNEDFQSFYNQSEGTFIVESELIDNLRVATSVFNRFFQVSNSAYSVGIACYLDPTNNNAYVRRRIDDSSDSPIVISNYFIDQSPPPNYTHFSISYSDKNYAFCGNGEDVSKDYTTTTHRTDNTTLNIGRQPNNLLTMLNGTMKKLVYYPLRLSNAQLQTLTK